jgi:hypothetical protein
MKNEFIDYCLDIGVSETLREQIKNMHSASQRFLGEEINAIFISDYVEQSGVRNFQNISFFANDRVAIFVLPNLAVFNVYGLKGLYPVMQTSFENYDFHKANSASKLRITLATESIHGTRHQVSAFSASGINCDYLFKICTEIIFRHF